VAYAISGGDAESFYSSGAVRLFGDIIAAAMGVPSSNVDSFATNMYDADVRRRALLQQEGTLHTTLVAEVYSDDAVSVSYTHYGKNRCLSMS
jgi:hypothetical protein